jgi:hypothetical protein
MLDDIGIHQPLWKELSTLEVKKNFTDVPQPHPPNENEKKSTI